MTKFPALYLLFAISVPLPLATIQGQPHVQMHGPASTGANSDTVPLPRSLSTITTDTGDYAPGNRDYTRYTDLRWCLIAATNTRDVLRRTLKALDNFDLVQSTPERDTLPAGAKTVARNCGARFTVAGTAIGDLPVLFDLALMAGNDSMAHAVLARLVDAAPTTVEKDKVLLKYVDHYLNAEPARVAAADSIVAQIEKLGQAGLSERLNVHGALLQYFGVKHYNSRLVRREAEQVISIIDSMATPELHHVERLSGAYNHLMLWAWLNYPDSIPVIAQRYQRYLRSSAAQGAMKKICLEERKAFICDLTSAPIDTVIRAVLGTGYHQSQQAAPPVSADFWFPAPGRDTVQPARGVVSVIINYQNLINCIRTPGGCKEDFDRLRRFVERYKSAGMSITMLANAPGYRLGGDPGPADSVAQSYRLYMQNYFKWPVTVAVRNQIVTYKMESPDGRIFYGKKYRDLYDSNGVVMTDREGKVIYLSGGDRLDINIDRLPRFELFVEHAMAASKQASHLIPPAIPSLPPPLSSSNK
jgi:hypothetical protein